MNLFYEQIANFYESLHFHAQIDRRVLRPSLPDRITFHGGAPQDRARLFGYFHQTSMERAGILQGEYLLLPDLHLIIGADGVCLKLNTAWEDYHGAYALERCYSEFDLRAFIDSLLARWDEFAHVARPAILSDLYLRNYFHCSLELIPRLRLMPPNATLLIHDAMLEKRFQTNLLALAMGPRVAVPIRSPTRVTDPVCVHDRLCSDGIGFLREATGLRAAPGTRRVYLRRAGSFTRCGAGGGIAETPEFLALLQRHGFETVEFGAGGVAVMDQVRMLDGAGFVLAPHGAALTNIAYMTAPATIVEIMGPHASRALFLHISAVLGLSHRVFYTDRYDVAGDLLPDIDALGALLSDIQ